MNFSVTIKPGLPIYEQVVFAVKKALVLGQIKPGEKFPSVRELSKELQINPNTAQKIVSQLVQQKVLEVRPGIGTMIAEPVDATEAEKADLLESDLESLVIEARRLRIKKEDLLKAIDLLWKL